MHDTTDPHPSHEVFPPSVYHCVLMFYLFPELWISFKLLSRDPTQYEVAWVYDLNAVSLLFYIFFLLGLILCSKSWENLLVGKITRWSYGFCSLLFLYLCYLECFTISKYDNVMMQSKDEIITEQCSKILNLRQVPISIEN